MRGLPLRSKRVDGARLKRAAGRTFICLGCAARISAADDLTGTTLMQEHLVGGHQRCLGKPALRCLPAQHIAQRHQRHALMVRHVVFNNAEFFSMRLACSAKVNRIHEAIVAAASQQLQAAQVGNGCLWRKHSGHEGGVGRYHFVTGRRTAQRQARHAEG